jgi:hypothetical protein
MDARDPWRDALAGLASGFERGDSARDQAGRLRIVVRRADEGLKLIERWHTATKKRRCTLISQSEHRQLFSVGRTMRLGDGPARLTDHYLCAQPKLRSEGRADCHSIIHLIRATVYGLRASRLGILCPTPPPAARPPIRERDTAFQAWPWLRRLVSHRLLDPLTDVPLQLHFILRRDQLRPAARGRAGVLH